MIEGSCLCGAIRYEVEPMPDKVFNCHCRFCRKAHGADYATLVLVHGATLKLSDEQGYLAEHLNDVGGYRAFCSHCGSRLMSYAADKALYTSVTMATIDTPVDFKPIAHVNTESRAAWCVPYEGIPEFATMPEGVV